MDNYLEMWDTIVVLIAFAAFALVCAWGGAFSFRVALAVCISVLVLSVLVFCFGKPQTKSNI